MSSRLPPLIAYQRGPREHSIRSESPLPPFPHWSRRSRTSMTLSSSPVRSSSPPRTPYSSREYENYGYIHNSSPTMSHGLDLPPLHRYSVDPVGWGYKGTRLPLPLKSAHRVNISETIYSPYDACDLPPSSEMEVEDVIDDSSLSLPEIDSETTSDSTPGHGSIYFSDSEEDLDQEDKDEDGKFSFGYSTLRSTCFRVSSERGQWKDDPLALEPSATANLTARTRQSVPTHSRQGSEHPSLSCSRPLSEPLPSTTAVEESQLIVESAHDDTHGKEDETFSSILLSDRPITPEPQALPEYSSPLPPSSPILSPMSGAVSSMSRSVSPLSLPPSSPIMMPCYTLHTTMESQDTEDKDDEIVDDKPTSTNLVNTLFPDDRNLQAMSVDIEVETDVPTAGPSVQVPSTPSSPSPGTVTEPRTAVDTRQVIVNMPASSASDTDAPTAPSPAYTTDTSDVSKPTAPAPAPPVASGSNTRSGSPDENVAAVKSKARGEKQKSRTSMDGKPLQDQIDNSQLPSPSSPSAVVVSESKKTKKSNKARTTEAPSKRKADALDELVSDAPVPPKKRRQSSVLTEKVASSSAPGKSVDVREDESEDEHDALPRPNTSKTKRKRAIPSKVVKGPSKRERVNQLFALESPQKTNDTELISEDGDEEMQGMIIECMATSRASSMPVSLVVRSVLQAHPGLQEKKTEKEWRKVVGRVLVNGMGGRGSGVFGKVDSSGKDDSDRPLEAQWFYVPERDEDQDRAALIRSMMPRPGKRSVTKQYKQYYWRPLDKISRWDPDDAL